MFVFITGEGESQCVLQHKCVCLLELNMLCEYVTRGYGDQPPSRSPRAWNGEGEVLGVVPLLCAQGREEEAQISLVAPEDVGPAEAETVILPRTPDEALVVDVARGLDSGSMIEQSHRILMQVSYLFSSILRWIY